jgi:hypothetical protein
MMSPYPCDLQPSDMILPDNNICKMGYTYMLLSLKKPLRIIYIGSCLNIAARIQLSRYYKDSICHSWPNDHFPNWMHFIGGLILDARLVPDLSVVVSSYNIKFTSLIEKAFFDNVDFWQYTGTRARTALVE